MFIPPAQMSGNTLKRAIYLTHKRKRSPSTERCLSLAMFIVFFHHQHWPLKYPTANEAQILINKEFVQLAQHLVAKVK